PRRAVDPTSPPRLASVGIAPAPTPPPHPPRRYHDRRNTQEIAALAVGDEATVYGVVKKVSGRYTRQRRPIVEAEIFDGTSYLKLTFFNQAWREKQLRPGTEAAFFGKVEHYRGRRQMTNPVVDVIAEPGEPGAETGVLVPVYPASGKAEVHTWQLRRLVANALERTRARGFADPLDESSRADLGLLDRDAAFCRIHQPPTADDARAATLRLTFDEFLRMQLGLVARKRAIERAGGGLRHVCDGALVQAFHARLPFALTKGQERSIDEIYGDLAGPAPMHRLLQGEVGSGKTVVALTALLVA